MIQNLWSAGRGRSARCACPTCRKTGLERLKEAVALGPTPP